jgi:hypothetical protein
MIELFGFVILYLSTTTGSALLARLSLMNSAALSFAATHASFFGIGLVRMLPGLRGSRLLTFSQLNILALALTL